MFDDAEPLSCVSAFFPLGALFNHACGASREVGPAVRYFDCAFHEGEEAPRIRFVAARAIEAGEEVTHAYLDPTLDVEERRYKLLLTYRFACACGRCREEEPRAGTAEDPLAGHFPHGAGADGLRYFFSHGGAYPPEEPPGGGGAGGAGAGAGNREP